MEMYQLALRIRSFRKLKGMTQNELAERLGISLAVIGSIERGTRKADDRILAQISEVLGVSKEELVSSQ